MLTEEQQKLVEDSLWVVELALKRLSLTNNNDMRQQARLYICKLVSRFDASKGVKWSTYAYKSIYFHIKWRLKVEQRKNFDTMAKCDYYEVCDTSFGEISSEQLERQEKVKGLLQKCNAEERQVAILIMQGYNHREIEKIIKKSRVKVVEIIKKIKEKGKNGDFNC